jgi:hypothetical protein
MLICALVVITLQLIHTVDRDTQYLHLSRQFHDARFPAGLPLLSNLHDIGDQQSDRWVRLNDQRYLTYLTQGSLPTSGADQSANPIRRATGMKSIPTPVESVRY